MAYRILIVDDENEMCISLAEILEANGFETIYETNPKNVESILRIENIDLVLMDIKMPEITGIDLLKRIKHNGQSIPIIMITGHPSIENAVKSMKYGALNFYVKPFNISQLINEIKQLSNSKQNRSPLSDNTKTITQNKIMREILFEIEQVAPTDASVLIMGESGTGKELIATEIYCNSKRYGKPFKKVNCGSIPDSLLTSELFGYEKGAFTDAKSQHIGYFEQAKDGTLFLDEIGDMSLKTQSKMLRVLQDGEIQRLGGIKSFCTNTRVLSATNKNISNLIENKLFREDLFYRLSVVTIELPPLRKRKDDILLLSKYFLDYFNRLYNKNIKHFTYEVETIFVKHSWPGNIRELKNCIQRAVIFSQDEIIEIKHLPSQYRELVNESIMDNPQDLYDYITRETIKEALVKSNGIKQKAAELLSIHRKTLYNRMKKLDME